MHESHFGGNGVEKHELARPLPLTGEANAQSVEALSPAWESVAQALAPVRKTEEQAARRIATAVLARIAQEQRETAPISRLSLGRTAITVLALAACVLVVATLNMQREVPARGPAEINSTPVLGPTFNLQDTTLAGRIQAAAPGEIIQVRPGRITESLRIEKPLRLTALGTALAEKG